MTEDIYGPEWRTISEECKRKAHYRCKCCWRVRRKRFYQLWRPKRLNAHHIRRKNGAHLVCLCKFCHMQIVHRFDRLSIMPLLVDTYLAMLLVFLAKLTIVVGAIYLILK